MQHELKLNTKRGVAEGLRVTFDGIIKEALNQSKRAVQAPEDAVHNYRRALRRAEALLLVSWDGVREDARRRVAFNLLRARRKTRFLRDSGAVLDLLESLKLEHEAAEAAWAFEAWLRSHDDDELGELAAWRLRKNARALAGLSDIYEVGLRGRANWELLLDAVRAQYEVTRKLLKRARRSEDIEKTHDLRKSARMLRYQLEALTSAPEGEALKSKHSAVKTAVAALGTVSDLAAAQALVESAAEDSVGVSYQALQKVLRSALKQRWADAFETCGEVFAVKASQWLEVHENKDEDGDDDAPSASAPAPSHKVKGASAEAPSKESPMSPAAAQVTTKKTAKPDGTPKTAKAASAKTAPKKPAAAASAASSKAAAAKSEGAEKPAVKAKAPAKAASTKAASPKKTEDVSAATAKPAAKAKASSKASSEKVAAEATKVKVPKPAPSTVVAGPEARASANAPSDSPDAPTVPHSTEPPTVVAGPEARAAAKS